ncbi:MAG: diguanylate cyclase [Butyrivibrio sp.]|jgi:GGDEF domain-containing protein|uniref:diguanylate cyclase domain-containing protein n=1 Tax=Butyrivibrio sp. TaxID=28121 RepID=UPI001EBA9FFE|nr:diguanylate cyclase [Butyrivibrio sp.]MBE5840753.1 diguanylate cyclase [Butyrivibrio sp.]
MVAKIAMDSVGDKGVVGRIGGDEFVILFEEISEEEELRDYLRKIRYAVRERFVDEGKCVIYNLLALAVCEC